MRFRRTMTVIVGVFFLVFGWRTVTLALHSLQNHPDSISSRQEERFADVIPAYSAQKENDISDTAEEIILVNKDHPLEETYQPDLVKLRDYGVEVDRKIYDSLLSMLQDGEKEGLEFWVASGYRSMERQRGSDEKGKFTVRSLRGSGSGNHARRMQRTRHRTGRRYRGERLSDPG